jgi:hypothetical protein
MGGPPPPLLQKCRVRRGEHAVVVRVYVACQARCVCMCTHVRLGDLLEEPLGLLRLALGLCRRIAQAYEQARIKHVRYPPQPNTDSQCDGERKSRRILTYCVPSPPPQPGASLGARARHRQTTRASRA